MADKIYYVGRDGAVTSMDESLYAKETELQKLLADNPELLSGEQMDPENPRRWLAVCREMPISADEAGTTTWRLDHLFLDQDAVPTLVEVKRSQNTEIRRTIVGQMLDYASNGVAHWNADKMRQAFEQRCAAEQKDPDEALADFMGDDAEEDFDTDRFWKQAETNLLAGRVRMVFVADMIPPELQRIVNFLNRQLNQAEVLAVSLQRFQGGDRTTLVPRVYGATVKTDPPTATSSWDESKFFAKVEAIKDGKRREVVRRLYDWVRLNGLTIQWWDKGGVGRFFPILECDGETVKPLAVRANGKIIVRFGDLGKIPAFATLEHRKVVLDSLNGIPGIQLNSAKLNKGQMFDAAVLADETAWTQFTELLNRFVKECQPR